MSIKHSIPMATNNGTKNFSWITPQSNDQVFGPGGGEFGVGVLCDTLLFYSCDGEFVLPWLRIVAFRVKFARADGYTI